MPWTSFHSSQAQSEEDDENSFQALLNVENTKIKKLVEVKLQIDIPYLLVNAAEFTTLIAKFDAVTIQILPIFIARKQCLCPYSIFTISCGLTYVQWLFYEQHLTKKIQYIQGLQTGWQFVDAQHNWQTYKLITDFAKKCF